MWDFLQIIEIFNIFFPFFFFFPHLQRSLKKDHFLWKLFVIEKDVVKLNEELEAERRNRDDVMQQIDGFEHEALKKRKEQAKYLKEIGNCEKRIAEGSNKLDKNVSTLASFC